MRRLAKSRTKKAVEVERRKTGLTRRAVQKDLRLILRSEQIPCSAKPPESIVMQQRKVRRWGLPAHGCHFNNSRVTLERVHFTIASSNPVISSAAQTKCFAQEST